VKVVITSEDYSSQKCCHCHQPLDGKKLEKNEIIKRKEREANFARQGRHPKRILSGLYAVRMCNHGCGITWNRDENAAWNILSIFLYQMYHHGDLPEAFTVSGNDPNQKRIRMEDNGDDDTVIVFKRPFPSPPFSA